MDVNEEEGNWTLEEVELLELAPFADIRLLNFDFVGVVLLVDHSDEIVEAAAYSYKLETHGVVVAVEPFL